MYKLYYSYIYQGIAIHSWSNFPSKPNRTPDVEEQCVFEKLYLILLSVLFIGKMHCLTNSCRDVTGLFKKNMLQKTCVFQTVLNQKCFVGLKQALSNGNNTRAIKKIGLIFLLITISYFSYNLLK